MKYKLTTLFSAATSMIHSGRVSNPSSIYAFMHDYITHCPLQKSNVTFASGHPGYYVNRMYAIHRVHFCSYFVWTPSMPSDYPNLTCKSQSPI